MKTLKKTLCLVLAVVMAVGVLILPANAATFTDEDKVADDYTIAVKTLLNYRILQGKKNGDELSIDPKGDVTRAEVATMTYRLLTGDTAGDYVGNYVNYAGVFSDVKADWQRGPVGFCANGKLVVGIGGDKYAPNAPVTGYELLAIMLRALGYGQLGEFTGAKWKENTYAQAVKSGLDEKVKNIDLSLPLSREKVAQIIYNTIKTPRVVYTPGYGYTYVHEDALDTENDLNVELIVDGKDVAPEFDKFGAPTKESIDHKFTYTWPVINIPDTYGKPMTVKKYYEAVTECDVATDFGLTSTTTATKYEFETYNNGIGNVGKAYIEPTDEVHVIGAQGRETAVYVYKVNDTTYRKIVYKDTVLMKVISSTEKLVDTAGHVVQQPTATVLVYKTNRMDGLNGENLGKSGYTTFTKTITTTEKYEKGTILSANVLTDTPYNTLSEKSTFVNVKRADSVQVTIDGVDVSSTPYGVGFVGTDGNTYRYSLTYAYNAVNGDGKTLNTTDLGKTYTVYLASTKATEKGNYNVIGIAPTEGYATAGVVTKVENVKVASDTKGNPLYAQQITVLTENGEQTILHVSNDKTGGEANAASIDPYIKKNDLIVFGVNPYNTKYYNVNGATPYATINSVKAGVADTLNPGKYPLVNDETVFFIETYTLSNSKRAYVTAGYDVIKGFKNIPDLADRSFVYDVDSEGLVRHKGMQYAVFLGDDYYADYVVIRFGTESSTVNTTAEKQYAYVDYLRYEGTVSESKVTFNAVIEGQRSKLEIASKDAFIITNGRNGLYTYGQYTNGTNGKVVGPVNHIDKSWAWKHVDGVIDLGDGHAIAADQPEGTVTGAKRFYTVADDVVIYIVNPMTGEVNLTAYDLDTIELKEMYQGAEIYFQLDEYGYIDLVYVVCDMKEDHKDPDNNKPVVPDLPIDLYIGNPQAAASFGSAVFYLNGTKFNLTQIPGGWEKTGLTEEDVIMIDGATGIASSTNGTVLVYLYRDGTKIEYPAPVVDGVIVLDIGEVMSFTSLISEGPVAAASSTKTSIVIALDSVCGNPSKITVVDEKGNKVIPDQYVNPTTVYANGIKIALGDTYTVTGITPGTWAAGTEYTVTTYENYIFVKPNSKLFGGDRVITVEKFVADTFTVNLYSNKSDVGSDIVIGTATYKRGVPSVTVQLSAEYAAKYSIENVGKIVLYKDGKKLEATESGSDTWEKNFFGRTTVENGAVVVNLAASTNYGFDLDVYVDLKDGKTITGTATETEVPAGKEYIVGEGATLTATTVSGNVTVAEGGTLDAGTIKAGSKVVVEPGATLNVDKIEENADVTVSSSTKKDFGSVLSVQSTEKGAISEAVTVDKAGETTYLQDIVGVVVKPSNGAKDEFFGEGKFEAGHYFFAWADDITTAHTYKLEILGRDGANKWEGQTGRTAYKKNWVQFGTTISSKQLEAGHYEIVVTNESTNTVIARAGFTIDE